MAADKARLAFVGLGRYSNVLADAAGRAGNIEVVNCFTRTAATRKEFAEKYSCRESDSLEGLLSDSEVEGVVVVTPHSTHADIICQAASAGKHVFIEKPLTLTVADADRAIDAANKAGVALQIGQHRRYQGAARQIRQMIDKGELGDLYQLESNLSMPGGALRTGWREDPAECPVGSMMKMQRFVRSVNASMACFSIRFLLSNDLSSSPGVSTIWYFVL